MFCVSTQFRNQGKFYSYLEQYCCPESECPCMEDLIGTCTYNNILAKKDYFSE